MSNDEKVLMMDRIVNELREFDNRLNGHLEALGVCYHRGQVSKELYDEAASLKEKMSDLLTLAIDWRPKAELNGVDLND